MDKTLKIITLFFICTMLIPFVLPVEPAFADAQDVRDTLVVAMRGGKGGEYEIIKYLKSDTAVEVIEEDGEYYRVRTEGGEEGWVLKKYITPDTPKSHIIKGLERRISRLRDKVAEAEKTGKSLREEVKAARRANAEKIKELEKLAGEHSEKASRTAGELEEVAVKYKTLVEQSRDVVELAGERDRLQAENERLSEAREQLREENERLKRREMMWWFAAGGAVFFVGWIAGKASRQRRY
jgi:SH3 domain protein